MVVATAHSAIQAIMAAVQKYSHHNTRKQLVIRLPIRLLVIVIFTVVDRDNLDIIDKVTL